MLRQSLIADAGDFRSGQNFAAAEAQLLADGFRDQAIVAGDDFQGNAEVLQLLNSRYAIGLGRIEEGQKSQKAHVGFVAAADAALSARKRFVGQTQRPQTLFAVAFVAFEYRRFGLFEFGQFAVRMFDMAADIQNIVQRTLAD